MQWFLVHYVDGWGATERALVYAEGPDEATEAVWRRRDFRAVESVEPSSLDKVDSPIIVDLDSEQQQVHHIWH